MSLIMLDSGVSPFDAFRTALSITLAAIAGRLMYRARLMQKGRMRFFAWDLVYEIPIAIGMGFIAHGLSRYLALPGDAELSAVAAASYLGPGGIEAIVARYLKGRGA